MSEENKGSGFGGTVAAGAVGAGFGTYALKSQGSHLVEHALKVDNDIFKAGGKKADFASKVAEVAAKPFKEGDTATFASKLNEAQTALAKTGEEALKGEAKKAAQATRGEALKGIKAGLSEAKTPIWKNLTGKQAAIVTGTAIGAAVVTKVAANAIFGGKHTARLEAERTQATPETARG